MVALHQNDCQLLWQRADAQNISFFYPLRNSSSNFFSPSLGELFEQLEAQKIYFLIKLCFQVITRVTAVGRLHITVVHTNSLHYLYEVAYRGVVSRVKFFGIMGGGVRRSFRNFKDFSRKQIIVNPAWAKFSLEIDYGTWWLICFPEGSIHTYDDSLCYQYNVHTYGGSSWYFRVRFKFVILWPL